MNELVNLAPRNLDEAMRFADMVANSDLAPAQYKGKPGNVLVAVQMGAGFVVHTIEGTLTGAAGDYLCRTDSGETWPMARVGFEATYEPVRDSAE